MKLKSKYNIINKKLHTYGCSFTDSCSWPTWATWMGAYYKDFSNMGSGGSGNHVIFQKLSEDLRNKKINPNDDVVIQWSSCVRADTKVDKNNPKSYVAAGFVLNTPWYDKNYIDEYFSLPRSVIETLNYISSAKILLENAKVNYAMTFMLDPRIDNKFGEPGFQWETYPGGNFMKSKKNELKIALDIIPEFDSLIDEKFTDSCISMHQLDNPKVTYFYTPEKEIIRDSHPSPLQHFTFFEKYLAPKFNYIYIEPLKEIILPVLTRWEDYVTNTSGEWEPHRGCSDNLVLEEINKEKNTLI